MKYIKQNWITIKDSKDNEIEFNTNLKTISNLDIQKLLEVGSRI